MKVVLRWKGSESAQINADPSQVCCFLHHCEEHRRQTEGDVLFNRATRMPDAYTCLRSGDVFEGRELSLVWQKVGRVSSVQ